jgi:hypothetical protein
MNTFVHLHSSSRWDKPDVTLKRAVKAYNEVADIITWTEIEAEGRERVIRQTNGDKFGLHTGDSSYANDCGISYRHERFKLIYKENYKSTNVNFYNKGGQKKDPQWATTAVLEDKQNGERIVVTVIHLASGIEGDFAAGKRTKAIINWYAAFRGAKNRANKLARKYKTKHVMFISDFNLDFKRDWVKRTVKSVAPAYTLTWKNLHVSGGTHGNRIIDATLVRGLAGFARLWKDDSSSDHRPYIETLRYLTG